MRRPRPAVRCVRLGLVLLVVRAAEANRKHPASEQTLSDALLGPATPASVGAASGVPWPADGEPTACADDPRWTDAAGRGCAVYGAEGWCNASYFTSGHESLATTSPATNPGDACCACGRGRGGCLQARADQYCAQAGVGVVARKVELFWNCYESIGTAEAAACVGVSGWYQRCRVGVGGAAAGGLHHERISAVLREGCVSKAEQARLRQAREQSRASRDSALARGEAPGSCMQAAMDALCDAQFAAGAVARRDFSQYLCCVRTVGAAAAGEQSLGCVDENGFFTDCAPCDRSAGFRDFSDQLRAVQRHGCQRADTSASGGGREGGGRGMGLARETAAASAHEAAHSTDGFAVGLALSGLGLLALATRATRHRAHRQHACRQAASAPPLPRSLAAATRPDWSEREVL